MSKEIQRIDGFKLINPAVLQQSIAGHEPLLGIIINKLYDDLVQHKDFAELRENKRLMFRISFEAYVEQESQQEFYATFGSTHMTKEGLSKLHRYVTVHAANYEEARGKMFSAYNNGWSHVYESKEAAGVDKFNLVELDFGE